jgi:hypothetical protein
MTKIILILTTVLSFNSYSQITVEKPRIQYVSIWSLDELKELSVGTKIVFEQNCNQKVEKTIVDGIVLFENVRFNKEKFSIGIEFKDTVVNSVIYYFSASQMNLLKEIGLSEIKAVSALKKGEWTFCDETDKLIYVVFKTKKSITVIKKRSH